MNVAVIGATGKSGERTLKELVSRGHDVKALVRNVAKVDTGARGVTAETVDLTDTAKLTEQLRGLDAVVSAYAPPQDDTEQLIPATAAIAAAARGAGVRLIVIGGAGGLFVAPGVTLRQSGHLPEAWLPIVDAHIKLYGWLKSQDAGLDWTYFAPAAFFEPGVRTGSFRQGKDDLITDGKGESRISMEDYAIALVNELETPEHRGERFTVGY